MVTINSAENALKSVYLGTVTELLNTRVNPLLTKIEQTSADVWGKEVRKAVSLGINGGIGAGDEDGALPKAHGNNYLQFVSSLKNLFGQIEISDKAIRASANDKGAFTDLLNAELDGLLKASKFNLGRMLYGDGTGKLAEIYDVESGSNEVEVTDTRNFVPGLAVDIYNGASAIGHRHHSRVGGLRERYDHAVLRAVVRGDGQRHIRPGQPRQGDNRACRHIRYDQNAVRRGPFDVPRCSNRTPKGRWAR